MTRARRQLRRPRRLSTATGILRQAPRWTWAVVGTAVAVMLLGLACLGLWGLGAGLLPRSTPTGIVELPTATATTLSPALPAATPTPTPPGVVSPTPAGPPSVGLGATKTRAADGMAMVYVPGGTFQMGSADSDPNASGDEKPRHEVSLDAFWIDRTEVTNAQYVRCVAAGACRRSAYADDPAYNGADYPVVGVAWQDAADYCWWTGGRLPSEAEWEYVARGPQESIYPWGDTFDGSRLNFCDRNCEYDWKDAGADDGYARAAPVGSLPAGASWAGAMDMAGNVWEWVSDWYGSYPSEPQVNPSGPSSGQERVLRGGGYSDVSEYVRAARRSAAPPDGRYGVVFGFRCVVAPGK